MTRRHHVNSHKRSGYNVSDYERGSGVVSFNGSYSDNTTSRFRHAPTPISSERAKEIGAPDWFARYEQAAADRELRGPGSLHRAHHPSWEDLTEDEASTLRHIDQRYDATMNVRQTDPSIDKQNLKTLEGLGFVRYVNGRVIPNFVFTENNAKDLGRYEGKT